MSPQRIPPEDLGLEYEDIGYNKKRYLHFSKHPTDQTIKLEGSEKYSLNRYIRDTGGYIIGFIKQEIKQWPLKVF